MFKELVRGVSTGTTAYVSDQDEFDNYNENIVVESEADSIIDFTEDNPFGDF